MVRRGEHHDATTDRGRRDGESATAEVVHDSGVVAQSGDVPLISHDDAVGGGGGGGVHDVLPCHCPGRSGEEHQ